MDITLKENAHSHASVKESLISFFKAKEDLDTGIFFCSPPEIKRHFLHVEAEQGAPTKALAPFPQS